MFEDKNINEFDLMMKSILDEGREEVPAGVWERVSEGLDKVAASKRKPAAVIWFRRRPAQKITLLQWRKEQKQSLCWLTLPRVLQSASR